MQQPRAKRYQVWFPMSFDSPERKDGMAVSRNLSNSGVLMATASELSVGAVVTVTFNLTLKDTSERTVQGRIVRVQTNAADPDGIVCRERLGGLIKTFERAAA